MRERRNVKGVSVLLIVDYVISIYINLNNDELLKNEVFTVEHCRLVC